MNLLLSRGRSNQYMWGNIALLASTLAAVLLLYPWGITYMVLGTSIINMFWLLVWVELVRREIGYTYWQLLNDILPFLGFTVLSILAAWYVSGFIGNLVIRLTAKVLLTAALYIFVMWVTRSVTFRECLYFLTKRKVKEDN